MGTIKLPGAQPRAAAASVPCPSCWRAAAHAASRRRVARGVCRASEQQEPGLQALLLEADQCVVDLNDAHRVAFNRAFHELGMDCVQWTPAVYADLQSKGDGTGEGLVAAYYGLVGWPTFLPTAEQPMFAIKVHELKQQQLDKMLKRQELPLRDGVAQVLTEAVRAGARVALLAHTCSHPSDDVVGCIMHGLQQQAPEVAAAAAVYSAAAAESAADTGSESDAGDEVGGGGGGSSSSFAEAAARVKQRSAQEFVDRLASALGDKQAAVPVQLDRTLASAGAPGGSSVSAAWLSAVAATLGVRASACAVAGSSGALVGAAAAAGMLAVAVPRKAGYATSYPAAAAKFEGWGPGYCGWPKLAGLHAAWWRQREADTAAQQRRRQ